MPTDPSRPPPPEGRPRLSGALDETWKVLTALALVASVSAGVGAATVNVLSAPAGVEANAGVNQRQDDSLTVLRYDVAATQRGVRRLTDKVDNNDAETRRMLDRIWCGMEANRGLRSWESCQREYP